MPMVRIELLPGRSREQKARAAREITEAVTRTLGAKPESTQIVFVEVERADWAAAGKLLDEG